MLAAVARRLNAPYPALLALAGAALALIPNVPTITLDPELALTLFVAPVLLDAAFDSSPRDLRQNWRVVGSLARLTMVAMARVQDVATAVILQFLTTFAVWLLAERLHLSGIITVVVFAITAARSAPDLIPARMRIPSYAVWEVTVFLLNVLAFILVGLQLKPILQRLGTSGLITYLSVALTVLLTAIVVRFVWVMSYTAAARWMERRRHGRDGAESPSYRVATI